MNNQWEAAAERLQRGDPIGAFRDYLQIESEGICLVERREYHQGLLRLVTGDVDLDSQDELLVVGSDGSFFVDSIVDEAQRSFVPIKTTGKYFDVCLLPKDPASGEARLLLASEGNAGLTVLHVHHVTEVRHNANLAKEQLVNVPGAAMDVCCVLGSTVLVATSDGELHLYNAQNFKVRPSRQNPLRLRGLIAVTEGNWGVGVNKQSGLCRYILEPRGLRVKAFGEGSRFAAAVAGDIRDIGTADIVAVTHGGTVMVFDGETLAPVMEASVPDEALAICCISIGKEGGDWVLIGGAANRVYGLAVNDKGELVLAKAWDFPHRITHLTSLNRHSGVGREQALAIGLITGEVQVCVFPTHRALSTQINACLRELRAGGSGWASGLLDDEDPRVPVYALSLLAADLDCQHLLEFLRRVGPDTPSLSGILSILKTVLEHHWEECQKEVSDAVFQLLERVSRESSSANLCDVSCATLTNIVHQPGLWTQRTQDLLLEAQQRRDRIMVFRPEQWRRLYQVISESERPDEAQQLVEILIAHRMDLLKNFAGVGRVTHLGLSSDGNRLLYRRAEGEFAALSPDLDNGSELLAGIAAFLALPGDQEVSYLVFRDDEALCLDREFGETHRFELTTRPQNVCLTGRNGHPIWMAGAHDCVLFGDLQGQWGEYRFPTPVAALVPTGHGGNRPVWVVSVTGELYRLPDPVPRPAQSNAQVVRPFYRIEPQVNVQSAISGQGGEVLVVATREVVLLKGLPAPPHVLLQPIPELPACAVKVPDSTSYGVHWIVGTRDKGLQFLDSALTVMRTTYLDDTATSLCCSSVNAGDTRLYVGCMRGNVLSVQLLSEDDIEEIQRIGDRSSMWYRQWKALPCAAQLVLVGVASANEAPSLGAALLYERLDPRISAFITLDELLNGIQILREQELIIAEGDARYRYQSEAMRRWVAAHYPDPFAVIREHAKDIVADWSFSDLAVVQEAASAFGTPQWVSETFSIKPVVWQRAVHLSGLLRESENAADSHRGQRLGEYVKGLAKLVGAKVKTTAAGKDPDLYYCTVSFSDVAFLGFENVLLVYPRSLGGQELAEGIKSLLFKLERPPLNIVLLLVPSKSQLDREGLYKLPAHLAVLDEVDIKEAAFSPSPQEFFLDALIRQIDIASLSPFQTAGPVRETFYGREPELNRLRSSVSRPGAKSCAVIGPRRIGKTSLLIRLQDELSASPDYQCLFVDACPYQADLGALFHVILDRLGIQASPATTEIVTLLTQARKGTRQRLVLLIDEVDDFLVTDGQNGSPFLGTLRALTNELGVKVILAGYRILYTQMRDHTSPLFNMLEPIELGRMEVAAAHDLVTDSLRHVYEIEGGVTHELLERTGYYPNFIQAACYQLIALKGEQGERMIRLDDIDRVMGGKILYDHMVQFYLVNLDERAKAVLFLLVSLYDPTRGVFVLDRSRLEQSEKSKYASTQHSKLTFTNQFTPYDLHPVLEAYGVSLSPHEIEDLVWSLVLASVVAAEPDTDAYRFTLRDLPIILRRHVEVELHAVNYVERLAEVF